MTIRTLVKSVALAALVTLPANAQAGVIVPCKVTEVAAFSDRVHVKCDGFTPISYYAVPTSGNSAEAARFTTMASMALGSTLWIEGSDNSNSGPSFGCQLHNCRRPLSFTLK